MRNYIKNVAIHAKGNYDLLARLLYEKACVPEYTCNDRYICYGEKMYPSCLYELKKPPFVLFYEGDISLLDKSMVGIVGSRLPNDYGISMTKKLVGHLKCHHVIVSGVAKGIDTIAHETAMSHNTIGVLGCGLDIVYPPQNHTLIQSIKKHQLLLSEYPQGTQPKKHHFPFRNRIIAALSSDIYVMAANVRSGTMTTVNEALALNRNVICLPYQFDDPYGKGCNQLIEEGAEILTPSHFL
ncbi:DNA processing protein DprA [Erysipelothrix larvae]|uniref:DNA processing protein DprA n=1 Tax=Erysipelothrix larvae TaxID=1514105 RepID=A0A0X8GZW8_9FIRM|nr:DNA-processing protein DprA [Erysipelothrix larvae]AMC93507.1 DNA processing protein DprA [Erysipelothrix larvae]